MPQAFISNAQAQAGRAPLAGALTASLPEVQYVRDASESVRFIVIHCSATRRDRPYPVELLRRDHLARGFREIGYHLDWTRTAVPPTPGRPSKGSGCSSC